MARRKDDDPVSALRRAVRKDCGKFSLSAAVAERFFSSTATTRTGAINCTTTILPLW